MLMLLLSLQIKVSNSALISAFMTDLEGDAPVTQVTHDLSLEIVLSTRKILCSNFTLVSLLVWLWSSTIIYQPIYGEEYGLSDRMHGWFVNGTAKGLCSLLPNILLIWFFVWLSWHMWALPVPILLPELVASTSPATSMASEEKVPSFA